MVTRSHRTLWKFVLLLAIGAWPQIGNRASADDKPGPFLWRIEGPKPSYVFGTIHLTDPMITRLKPIVARAIEKSDVVLCEVPLDEAALAKLVKKISSVNQPLSVVLPKDLYNRAMEVIKIAIPNANLDALDRIPIWALASLITSLDQQVRYPHRKPLDDVIYKKAQAAGKEVGGLETDEEQLDVMGILSTADQIKMLRSTLDELDRSRREGFTKLEELRAFYLAGDLDALYFKMTHEADKDGIPDKVQESFTNALLTQRNRHMAARIHGKRLLVPEKSCFFAVGAGHPPGPDGAESVVADRYHLPRNRRRLVALGRHP